MRIFAASLATETNTFSPIPTDRASFEQTFYAGPGEHPETPTLCSAPIPVLRRRAERDGFALIEGTATWAEPGGLVRTDVYQALRDEILGQLRAALPVDGVVLGLHGAMVARDIDDCEGDLLARVRDLVGPDVVIAAELDPHSHLTAKRVAAADILAAFLEFPHTDFVERAEHVVDLALAACRGEVRPVISTCDCRMVDVFPTTREPTRSFVGRMRALQGQGGVLSVSLIHGFMAADVPEMGTQILVVTDDARDTGDRLAADLAEEVRALRGTTIMPLVDLDTLIDQVSSAPADPRPFVVADVWDNPGGGVAGDSTAALSALIAAGLTSVGVATIWDPIAAAFCLAAGPGTVMPLRFGGKAGAASGPPIDAEVQVLATDAAAWQSFGSSRVPLGPSAAIRLVGTEIDIILNTNRTQTFEPDVFTNLGLDPMARQVLLVKSTNHFSAGFKPIAREIVYLGVDGIYPNDPRTTPYRKLTRPIWPRDPQA